MAKPFRGRSVSLEDGVHLKCFQNEELFRTPGQPHFLTRTSWNY